MEGSETKIKMILYFIENNVKIPVQKLVIIPNTLYFIGRSKKVADISLDIKFLSRRHAELYYFNNNKILIRDLGSRNGTYLNKIRIEPLKDIYFTVNDILSIGNIENEIYFYELDDEKREKYPEFYQSEKIDNFHNNDENMEIKNTYSNPYNDKPFDFHNNYTKTYSYKNNTSKRYSNKSRSKSRNSRSRSRETYIQQFRDYPKGYNISPRINYLNEYPKNEYEYEYYNRRTYNKDKNGSRSSYNNLEDYKLYERNSRFYDRKEDYKTRDFIEEKERTSLFRISQRSRDYIDKDFERDEMFLNIYRDKYENNNNLVKNGFIKCYVSGYMVLNIRK